MPSHQRVGVLATHCPFSARREESAFITCLPRLRFVQDCTLPVLVSYKEQVRKHRMNAGLIPSVVHVILHPDLMHIFTTSLNATGTLSAKNAQTEHASR